MATLIKDLFDLPDKVQGGEFVLRLADGIVIRCLGPRSVSSAIESIRLPARSPNLNAYAERFVCSIKSQCLDQMVFFSENSLRHAISEFAEHYHREPNHQGLDNRIIRPEFVQPPQHGEVRRRERLGGLLNYYYRRAA